MPQTSGMGSPMEAFMRAFQETSAQLQQQQQGDEQLQWQRMDRTRAETERQRQITRQTTADTQAAEDRRRTQALQQLEIPGTLAELGSTADTPSDAQRLIEIVLPGLMDAFGQETMAFGQPAVEMATQTINTREHQQGVAWLDRWAKSPHAVSADGQPPTVRNLPPYLSKLVDGATEAPLPILEARLQTAITVPQPTTSDGGFTLTPGQVRFAKDGKRIASVPEQTPTPPRAGYRWLVQADGEPFEWPDNQRAPRGAKPYDEVAARSKGSSEASAATQYSVAQSQQVLRKIDDLLGTDPAKPRLNWRTAGIGGTILSGLPIQSEARDVAVELQSLSANIAFDQLARMREASKTGGALGNVSDTEIGLLQNVVASIRQDQSPENLIKQLGYVRESAQRFMAEAQRLGVRSTTPASTTDPVDEEIVRLRAARRGRPQ